MKQRKFGLALLGALSVVIDCLGVNLITGYLNQGRQSTLLSLVQYSTGTFLAWPLIAVQSLFADGPASQGNISPAVFLGLLLVDVLIYALPIYAVLAWYSKRS